MRHLIIFQAFFNVKETIQSFESMYLDEIDYFVVENKSKYSHEIKNYFQTKRLKGYIQFEENIGSNAMNIFLNDYWDLLKQYDLITITEGDLYIYDIKSSIEEVKMGFKRPNVLVSAIGLYYGNVFNEAHRTIGLDSYFEFMKKQEKEVPLGNGFGGGGIHFLTFTNKTVDVIKGVYCSDWLIYGAVNAVGKGVHTNQNKAYHLTWDLLGGVGSEYEKFRADIEQENMFYTTKVANYIKII